MNKEQDGKKLENRPTNDFPTDETQFTFLVTVRKPTKKKKQKEWRKQRNIKLKKQEKQTTEKCI